MVSCSEFRREYSDFRDGAMPLPRRLEVEGHLAGCSACARLDRAIGRGVVELQSVPPITPSSDFLSRLQHRVYHVDDERAFWSRPDLSGTSVGFVLLLVVLIAGATWIPLLRAKPLVLELAPVAAVAPQRAEPAHALFRAGPLLESTSRTSRLTSAPGNTIFFRYMPLGVHADGQRAEHRVDFRGR